MLLMSRRLPMASTTGILALALVLVTLPAWATPYWTRIFTGVAMWAGLALSWNILCGYAGYISFGHVAFFGIGAYSTAILMQPEIDWNFFLTLPVAALVAGLVAAIVGWPTLRLRGAYFAIATWALAEAIRQFVTIVGFTGGSFGLTLPVQVSTSFFYYVMLATTVSAFVICYVLLERSRFGFKVKALRDNETAAQSLGIHTTVVKIEVFVLSAMIAAVLGGINAYWITFINPQSVLTTVITDQLVVMVLLGGLGHMWAPAFGAAALYLLNRLFVASFGDTTAYIAAVGGLVILIVLFLPDGLSSLWPRARRLRLVRRLLSPAALFPGRRRQPASHSQHESHRYPDDATPSKGGPPWRP